MSYPRAQREKSLWVATGRLAGLISNLTPRNSYNLLELFFFSRPSHFAGHMELWNIGAKPLTCYYIITRP